jgi:hypothetical protein
MAEVEQQMDGMQSTPAPGAQASEESAVHDFLCVLSSPPLSGPTRCCPRNPSLVPPAIGWLNLAPRFASLPAG